MFNVMFNAAQSWLSPNNSMSKIANLLQMKIAEYPQNNFLLPRNCEIIQRPEDVPMYQLLQITVNRISFHKEG